MCLLCGIRPVLALLEFGLAQAEHHVLEDVEANIAAHLVDDLLPQFL